jgi:tRNA (cmo5U34)-methyltransferase
VNEQSGPTEDVWTEEDSERFIRFGEVVTPDRNEIREALLSLIPADLDEPFLAVELGVGAGWLSAAVLDRFPMARVLGLDRSPTMLEQTRRAADAHRERIELRLFRLEDPEWLGTVSGLRAVLSSLVIHHLDGPGKAALYAALHERLEPGGALLIADLVAPTSERENRYLGAAWDEAVRARSLALTGGDELYEEFLRTEWNYYRYPDPFDKPSSIPEHLTWLREAGFTGVDVFWLKAGHAVYGGYRR